MGPRFPQQIRIQRPTFNGVGDRVLGAATLVSGATWQRRLKSVIGGQGEHMDVDAQGFLPAGTDVQRRDQLLVSGTDARYEVVTVVPAHDDRGREDHIGVELVGI